MLTVNPTIIDSNGHANVSHSGSDTITVTITSQDGDQVTITVPPNTVVQWSPPAGWTQARFTAPGCAEVARYIRDTADQASA